MGTCIIVGGGAAGMMAAIAASDCGEKVILLEQNEKLGKKIYITGKGRCNVTNACDADTFFNNIVSNPKFMYSAFYGYDNNSVMSLIENSGCKLKVERGNRVFPVSDHSSDIINALSRAMEKRGVKVRLNSKVESLIIRDNVCYGVVCKNEEYIADRVILATGGISYDSTGSKGDGINWAKQTGHNIIKCTPALVPFVIKEEWCKELQGLSLKNVSLIMEADGKKIYSDFGEMLFTHFGVSGPLILSASSFYAKYLSKKNKDIDVKIKLDLKTGLDEEKLDKRILRDFEKYNNKRLKNGLNDLLPGKLIPVIIDLSGIDPEKEINIITKEERKRIVKLLKKLEMTVLTTRGFNEAIITQGGVAVKDINASTMESKIIKNLFFSGEMIDVDALTGGFNLQIAWSTGHLAGESI